MGIKNYMNRALLASIILAFAYSTPVEAQLIKKVAQGVENVNKGLERANDILRNGDTNDKNSNNRVLDETGWKNFKRIYQSPYFTRETKYMTIDCSEYRFSDVHDGVFAIRKGMKCEFWKVTGEKLFDADWKAVDGSGTDFPIFSGGVAVAQRVAQDSSGKSPICLLYIDGRVKELDPSYECVTNFMDGVALVTARLNYKTLYFYIDVAGNKIYPNLTVNRNGNFPIRPLRDGLRAFYGEGNKWGYIDNKGNVIVAPQYDNVTDFSNGYAWVSIHSGGIDSKSIIDTTGNIVFTLPDGGYYTKVSDVADGVFCMELRDGYAYYDLTGKKLADFKSASGFYDGYAFIALGHEHADVIDRNFNIIRRMPYNDFNVNDVSYQKPNFNPFGLATVHYGNTVIDPKGNIIIVSYDNHNGTRIGGFRQFTECGYMSATSVYLNRADCFAYVKSNGEIAWLFSGKYTPCAGDEPLPSPVDDPNPEPEPQPEPWEPVIIDRDQKSIGIKLVEKVSYNVKAVANPLEGGSVSVSSTGPLKYGDYVTLSASANKDWGIQSIETDVKELSAPKIGEPFAVIANQTITVNFVKKEVTDAPNNTGNYRGLATFEDFSVPVYAEITQKGDNETPYGSDTYGFVALMFDPERRYIDDKGEIAANFFAVPLKIVGVQKHETDPSKQWLVFDGGSYTAHDIKVSPKCGALAGLFVNFMLSFDGFTTVNSEPRRYRIEMLNIDPETGEFQFGTLQTYSVLKGGWVSGGDRILRKTTQGFFMPVTDTGYRAETFQGAKMKKCDKRNDVLWYPPESWNKEKSGYQQLMESMRDAYRNAKSDYETLFDE